MWNLVEAQIILKLIETFVWSLKHASINKSFSTQFSKYLYGAKIINSRYPTPTCIKTLFEGNKRNDGTPIIENIT